MVPKRTSRSVAAAHEPERRSPDRPVPLAEKLAASEIGADTVPSFSQQPQADQEIGAPS
jgi:hypothetical protein